MGRGQDGQRDAFSGVLGEKRGAKRPEDDFLAGHPAARPEVDALISTIVSGDAEPALALLGAQRRHLDLANPYVEELLEALSREAVSEELPAWDLTAETEAPFWGTTRRQRGKIRPLGQEAEKMCREAACALVRTDLRDKVAAKRALRPEAAAYDACRIGLVTAFADTCHRAGLRCLTTIGGGQDEMDEHVGDWPPAEGLASFWGLGDWQSLIHGWFPLAPLIEADIDISQGANVAAAKRSDDIAAAVHRAVQFSRQRKWPLLLFPSLLEGKRFSPMKA